MWIYKNLDRFLFDENFITHHHLTSMIICIFWRNIINQAFNRANSKYSSTLRIETELFFTQTKYHLDCTLTNLGSPEKSLDRLKCFVFDNKNDDATEYKDDSMRAGISSHRISGRTNDEMVFNFIFAIYDCI